MTFFINLSKQERREMSLTSLFGNQNNKRQGIRKGILNQKAIEYINEPFNKINR